MKSSKTMLAIARENAYSRGIQNFELADGMVVQGFFLNRHMLATLYNIEGFREKTMDSHLMRWVSSNKVRIFQDGAWVAFLPCQDEKQYRMLSEADCNSVTVKIMAAV